MKKMSEWLLRALGVRLVKQNVVVPPGTDVDIFFEGKAFAPDVRSRFNTFGASCELRMVNGGLYAGRSVIRVYNPRTAEAAIVEVTYWTIG